MLFELHVNNQLVKGPIDYVWTEVVSYILQRGGDYRLVPQVLQESVVIGDVKLYPVIEVESHPTREYKLSPVKRTVKDDMVVYKSDLISRTDEELKTYVHRELSVIHDDYDKSTTEFRNILIKTDLEARINAKGTLDEFEAGRIWQAVWRGIAAHEGGPRKVVINNTSEMRALYTTLINHLHAGFAAREIVEAFIDSSDRQTLLGLDLSKKWSETLSTLRS